MGNGSSVALAADAPAWKVAEAAGGAPGARVGVTAVALDGSRVLVFGGTGGGGAALAEPRVLHLGEGSRAARWASPPEGAPAASTTPCARSGHALVRVPGPAGGEPRALLLGGCSPVHGYLADAAAFDPATWEWTALTAAGDVPCARDKLAAVAVGDAVYVFGGFGAGGGDDGGDDADEDGDDDDDDESAVKFTWFDDAYKLTCDWELGTANWQRLATRGVAPGEEPTARAAAGAFAHGRRVYVFGGRDSDGRQNDMYSLDLDTLEWRAERTDANNAPTARSFHAAVGLESISGTPGAVVFGGVSPEGEALGGLNVFDLRSSTWAVPRELTGEWPCERLGAAVALAGQHLVVFGGSTGEGEAGNVLDDVHVVDLAPVAGCLRQPLPSPSPSGKENKPPPGPNPALGFR